MNIHVLLTTSKVKAELDQQSLALLGRESLQ
jgi:hypothetical protein